MFEIFLLSLVQGVTEFLPISSSAHLILISKSFDLTEQGLSLDISLHIGSLLAVIIYFRKDLREFIKNKNFFFKILLSSLPVMIVGFFLVKLNIIQHLRNFKIIGWMTIIFGIFFSDKRKEIKNVDSNFDFKSVIIIGLFQVLSLVPGVSRSGIVISASRILNFKREDSAKIAFLLSIPTLSAVSLFNIFYLYKDGSLNVNIVNLLAIFFSLVFSYITIKYFLKFIKKFSLKIFVIYRILIGVVILYFSYS